MADQFVVNVMGLNVREKPTSVSSINIVGRINQGDRCEHFPSDLDNTKWIRIRMMIDDSELVGFVAKRFLDPADGGNVAPQVSDHLSVVHMPENKRHIDRDNKQGRAFPIGESNRPKRVHSSIAKKAASLHKIVDWLDVEKSKRFAPESSKTFCNIYAYDYVYLTGCYIPRVWWMSSAIANLVQGKEVTVKYGQTVKEMNANSLHEWFEEYGGVFGWKRKFDITEVQEDANKGKVCIITARRIELNRSGHIVAVVPEVEGNDALSAVRFDDGRVKFPLQSQAGGTNRKYFKDINGSKWWSWSIYSDFGFWVHD